MYSIHLVFWPRWTAELEGYYALIQLRAEVEFARGVVLHGEYVLSRTFATCHEAFLAWKKPPLPVLLWLRECAFRSAVFRSRRVV